MTDVTIAYDPSVQLGIPLVVVGRERYDDFRAKFATAVVPDFVAYVKSQGCNPPTTDAGWAIALQPSPYDHEADRLVWYQPEKLAEIHSLVSQVSQLHPDVTEVVVFQGHSWRDLGVVPVGAQPPDEAHDEPDPHLETEPADVPEPDSAGLKPELAAPAQDQEGQPQ